LFGSDRVALASYFVLVTQMILQIRNKGSVVVVVVVVVHK
jgi:hypothetical protein